MLVLSSTPPQVFSNEKKSTGKTLPVKNSSLDVPVSHQRAEVSKYTNIKDTP